MSDSTAIPEVFWTLLNAACDGSLSVEQTQELDAILASNAEACKLFADHFQLKTDIRFLGRVARVRDIGLAEIRSTFIEPPTPSSGIGFLGTAFQGTVGFFSQEVPFSLLIATLITVTGLWAGSMVYITRPEPQIVRKSPPMRTFYPAQDSTLQIVGRITGMMDCRWAKDARAPSGYDNVLLGRTFKLDAGLVEITYNSGARVILQGPCTYEAESRDGGFLSVGKLTAKLEKKGSEVRGQGSEKVVSGQWLVASETNPKSQITKSQISNPQSLIPSPSFAVRTPTATVTDLGTEFGVEVTKEGTTTSHVFQGTVEVRTTASRDRTKFLIQTLHADESARVEANADRIGGNRIVVLNSLVRAVEFIREIPKPLPKPSEQYETIAFWQFNGKDFLADSSGHGHTLINRGATQQNDTALFDGKALLQTADSIDLSPYGKVRVSWSHKFTGLLFDQLIWEQSADYNTHEGAIAAALWDPAGRKNTGMVGIHIHAPTGVDNVTGYNIDTYDVLPDVWESVTAEFRRVPDSKDQKLSRTEIVKVFKDRVRVGTGSTFEDYAPPDCFISAPFFIGGRDDGKAYFIGQIDNVKIEGVRVKK